MGKFPTPCIECGALTLGGTRCEIHKALLEKAHDQRRAIVKKTTGQYSGSYRSRAKKVRQNAFVCHLCGLPAREGDPWEADHIIPADPNSALVSAHRSCNQSRGNKPLN